MKYFYTLIQLVFILTFSSCHNITSHKSFHQEGIYLNNLKGNDRNKGDFKHPLKSISRLNEIINDKSASIFLAGGQKFDGTIILKGKSGSASDSIKISSWGDGKSTINGGKHEALIIDNCRFISVRNIDLSGDGRKEGNSTNGLSFINCRNSIVENVNSRGFQISGVDLYNCRKMVVKNVYAFENGFCGINVMGSEKQLSGHILIKDSKAENNPGDPAILNNHSGNGILVGNSDSVLIDHCTATNNGWDMPRQGNGPVGIWAWGSDHVTIQYCISYRNKTSKGAQDGGGFDFDGGMTNSILQYCLSYENQGAGYGLYQFAGASDWYNNIVRYCISINDATTTKGAGCFFIWNGNPDGRQLRDCYIYNNLAYSTYAPVLGFESSSNHENFDFSNNIFMGRELIAGIDKGNRFQGNDWWNIDAPFKVLSYHSIEAWAKATGQETLYGHVTGINADPLLKGPLTTDITDPYKLNTLIGYSLQDNSPLRDKGIVIKSKYGIDPPSVDFFGNPVTKGKAPDPGVFELQ